MKELEVRCCCNPSKLLGTVRIPESLVRKGKINIGPIETEIEYYDQSRLSHVKSYLALKSNEVPLEIWETIPGFIRNPQ